MKNFSKRVLVPGFLISPLLFAASAWANSSSITDPATTITGSGATLNGRVSLASGTASSIQFQYGLTTGYGSTVAGTPSTTSTFGVTPISATVSGLICATTYHFRMTLVDSDFGLQTGSDATFTTLACPAPAGHYRGALLGGLWPLLAGAFGVAGWLGLRRKP